MCFYHINLSFPPFFRIEKSFSAPDAAAAPSAVFFVQRHEFIPRHSGLLDDAQLRSNRNVIMQRHDRFQFSAFGLFDKNDVAALLFKKPETCF